MYSGTAEYSGNDGGGGNLSTYRVMPPRRLERGTLTARVWFAVCLALAVTLGPLVLVAWAVLEVPVLWVAGILRGYG